MKTLTMIEMEGCPYCANAHRAMEALRTEGYEDVQVADKLKRIVPEFSHRLNDMKGTA